MNYVEELEKQNEDLKQKLAFATQDRYVVKWIAKNEPRYNSTFTWIYEMRIRGMLYGIILEHKVWVEPKGRYRVLLTKSMHSQDSDSIQECMDYAQRYFEGSFLGEINL